MKHHLKRDISYNQEKLPRRKTARAEDLQIALGYKSAHLPSLPTDLESLRSLAGSPNCTANTSFLSPRVSPHSLGFPSNRREVHILTAWVNEMMEQLKADQAGSLEDQFETSRMLFEVSIAEILQQISVSCYERGQLLERVIKFYIGMLERALKLYRTKVDTENLKRIQEIDALQKDKKNATDKLLMEAKELKGQILFLNFQLKEKEVERQTEEAKVGFAVKKMKIVQSHYKHIKKELLFMKERVRIMKANMEGGLGDIDIEKQVIQEVRRRYYKKKRNTEIEHEVMQDPALTDDIETVERLVDDIRRNEVREHVKFTSADSTDAATMTEPLGIDQEVQAYPLLKDRRCQTKTIAPEPIGQAVQPDLAPIVHSFSFMSSRVAFGPRGLGQLESLDEFPNDLDESPIKKNSLLATTSLQQLPDTSLDTQPLDQSFKSNDLTPIADAKTSIAKPNRFERRMRRLMTGIVLKSRKAKSAIQKVEVNFITATLSKIRSIPPTSVKQVIAKKILLKQISLIYYEKQRLAKETASESLAQTIFGILLTKYGIQKVAESKFKQLVRSCAKYNKVPRICTFSRFIGLYDELSAADLSFFLNAAEHLGYLRSASEQEIEIVAIVKAIEVIKARQDCWSLAKAESMIASISRMKVPDPITKQPSVSIDNILGIILEAYLDNKDKGNRLTNAVFSLADSNNDGYLELSEFNFIVQRFSAKPIAEAQALFEEYADVETEDLQSAMSAENFMELAKCRSLLDIGKLESLPSIEQTLSEGNSRDELI